MIFPHNPGYFYESYLFERKSSCDLYNPFKSCPYACNLFPMQYSSYEIKQKIISETVNCPGMGLRLETEITF